MHPASQIIESRRSSRLQRFIPLLALLMITFAAYIPAIGNSYIWDDDIHVTENHALENLDGLRRIWFEIGTVPQYYPLVHTTFWIEHHIWGLDSRGYHIVNIVLHALGTGLLWIVLRRLRIAPAVAWLIAAVFALHPVHVESVAWISERKNVLSLVFYLAAMLAYLRFDDIAAPSEEMVATSTDVGLNPVRKWFAYALAIFFFALALLSKTVTCSLPAAILLLIWWKRGRLTRRDLFATLPLFVIGIGFAALTAWMERHIVGASGSEWNYNIVERFLIAGNVVWFYAGKLIWPVNLAFIYPRWSIDAHDFSLYVAPIAAILVLIALWLLRHRIGRGPLTAVLFFGGTLTPALGFFDVYPFRYSFVADHFQYLASIGLITLLVSTVIALIRSVGRSALAINLVLWPPVLSALAFLSMRQMRIYQDNESLWSDTLQKNSTSFIANGNYGDVLLMQGKTDLAMQYWRKALEYKPDLAEAHNSLGVEYAKQGDLNRAITEFQAALDANNQFAAAHNGMGTALARQGRFDKAIPHFIRAVELMPSMLDARMNLGLALFRVGEMSAAEEQLRVAASDDQGNGKPHYLLGSYLASRGEDSDAIDELTRALTLDPDNVDARFALGLALMRTGHADEAVEQFEIVLRVQPNHAGAQNALAQLRQSSARHD